MCCRDIADHQSMYMRLVRCVCTEPGVGGIGLQCRGRMSIVRASQSSMCSTEKTRSHNYVLFMWQEAYNKKVQNKTDPSEVCASVSVAVQQWIGMHSVVCSSFRVSCPTVKAST